jgi:hypothetical protein
MKVKALRPKSHARPHPPTRSIFSLPVTRPLALCSPTLPPPARTPPPPSACMPLPPARTLACRPSPPAARHRHHRTARPPITHRRLQRATTTVGPHARLQATIVAWPPGSPVTILAWPPARALGHRSCLLTAVLARLSTPQAATSSALPQPILLHPGVRILSSSGPDALSAACRVKAAPDARRPPPAKPVPAIPLPVFSWTPITGQAVATGIAPSHPHPTPCLENNSAMT